MAIDPRIAMGFQMPEQPSRLGMAANALQLKNMLMQGQMQEAEMASKRAELERQTGIRNFLQTTDVNTPEGMAAFRKAYPMEAPKIEAQMLEPQIKRAGLEKDQAQAKKYGTDAQAAEFKLKQDKVNQNLQLLGSVQTPEQAAQWVSAGVTQGLLSMEQAQAEIAKIPRDAQGFAQWKQGQQAAGMTVSQQMEQMWKAKEFGLNVEKFDETKRSNRVTEGISAGNLSVARGNLGLRQKELEQSGGAGKPPSGYRWTQSGALEPIPGGPADPATQKGGAPTEDERRSAGLAVRMEAALKRVGEVTAKNASAAKPELTAEIARGVPLIGEPLANTITSEDRQRVDTAQIDALDAALTLATGAAYTKEQLKGLAKSYFPQIGDDAKTVADKNERLKQVIESARIRAGRSAGDIDRALNAGKPAGGPAVGSVVDGYRFKGGNPADQKNWEKL